MALRATLGCDTNFALSGQTVRFTLTVTNPTGGTATTITQIAPTVTPAGSSKNIGLPLLNMPPASLFIGAGSSATFTWTETFFAGQEASAQSNSPTGSWPLVVGADVYATDGTITSAPTVGVYVFPNIGVNTNTAFTLPTVGTMNFQFNPNSQLIGALATRSGA